MNRGQVGIPSGIGAIASARSSDGTDGGRSSAEVAIRRPLGTGDRVLVAVSRALSAILLMAIGGSHLVLWFVGYGAIPTIGLSFLLNAIGGLLLALAVLGVRLRHLQVVALVGALFAAGTLAALGLARTVGLFGFVDAFTTPLVPTTLVIECAGVVVLATTAVIARWVRRSG
jgi:hypothetical protein